MLIELFFIYESVRFIHKNIETCSLSLSLIYQQENTRLFYTSIIISQTQYFCKKTIFSSAYRNSLSLSIPPWNDKSYNTNGLQESFIQKESNHNKTISTRLILLKNNH